MRLFCLIMLCLFWTPLVHAYMEVNEDEVLAGEHNTGMYKLSSKNIIKIKELKQVDEILSKHPNGNLYADRGIKGLLQDVEEEGKGKELSNLLSKVISQTKNIKELINNNSDAYQQIRNAANNSIKDTQIIDNINTKLIRGRS